MQLIKVAYIKDGELSKREYTYYSAEPLQVGDVVKAPVRDTTSEAQVTEIDVPESAIAAFRDKVKVIPAGSIMVRPAPEIPLTPYSPDDGPEEGSDESAEEEDDGAQGEHAIIRIGPEHDPAVRTLAEHARGLLTIATGRAILAEQDLKPAVDDLSIIARASKSLEEKRNTYLAPLREHTNAINATFKSISAPLDEADRITRQKIQAYRAEVERRRAEAEAINKAKEELAMREAEFSGTGEISVDTTPVGVPMTPARKVYAASGTLGTSKVKKWELLSFADVPDDFKQLDTARINRVVKAGGSIAGIRTYEEDGLRLNTRQ